MANNSIQSKIEVIRNETREYANSKERVATVLTELNKKKADLGADGKVLPEQLPNTAGGNADLSDYALKTAFKNGSNEALSLLGQPTLSGNVLTLKFTGEDGLVQQKNIDLSGLVTTDIKISNAAYNASTNIITLTNSDGTNFQINLSEFQLLVNTNADGTLSFTQEGVEKVKLEKVAATGSYADLKNKPSSFPPAAHTHNWSEISGVPNSDFELVPFSNVLDLSKDNYSTLETLTGTISFTVASGAKFGKVARLTLTGGGVDFTGFTKDNESLDYDPAKENIVWFWQDINKTYYHIERDGESVSNYYTRTESDDRFALKPKVQGTAVTLYGFDENGNPVIADASTATADTVAPTAATNIRVTNAAGSTIDLAWDAATDNVGIWKYELYKDGILIQEPTGTTANVSGLTPNTSYQFYLVTVDTSGNKSGQTTTITGTTIHDGGGSVDVAAMASDIQNLNLIQDDVILNFDKKVDFNGTLYDDWVHPSVIKFATPWNGHKYWMGITAYPATQSTLEDPFLFYSDDGITWKTMAGAPNPVYGLASGYAHNSDSNIFFENSRVWYTYRAVKSGDTGATIFAFYTDDAVNFSQPVAIFDTADGTPDLVSQSLLKMPNGDYYLFGTPTTDTSKIRLYKNTTIGPGFTFVKEFSAGVFNAVWHSEVKLNPADGYFYIIGTTGGAGGGDLVFGKFLETDNVINFRNNVALVPRADKDYNKYFYKCSFWINVDGSLEVWAGLKGDGLSGSGTKWRVEKLRAERYLQTLDKTPYQLVADMGNDAAFRQMADKFGLITMTVNAYGNIHGFSETLNRPNELSITNGRATIQTNAAADQNKYFYYGLNPGDEVAFEKDENNLKIYINGYHVFTRATSELYDGFSVGDDGGGTLSNIKFWQKPAQMRNVTEADNKAIAQLAGLRTNPTLSLGFDEFTDGVITQTEDGKAYIINGTVTEESGYAKILTGSNILLPHNGAFDVMFKQAGTNRNWAFIVDYVDADNYTAVYYEQYDTTLFNIGKINAISSFIRLPVTSTNYSSFRFVLQNNMLKVYGDNSLLRVMSFTPTGNKFGFSNPLGYGSEMLDYFAAKKL